MKGIGTDLVEIARMTTLLAKHGGKAALRILTDDEMVGFHAASNPAAFLAKRFAAKEAASKALGTGFRDGLSLRHIGVRNTAQGKPELYFSDRGAEMMSAIGATQAWLSLSDERAYALAFVVLN